MIFKPSDHKELSFLSLVPSSCDPSHDFPFLSLTQSLTPWRPFFLLGPWPKSLWWGILAWFRETMLSMWGLRPTNQESSLENWGGRWALCLHAGDCSQWNGWQQPVANLEKINAPFSKTQWACGEQRMFINPQILFKAFKPMSTYWALTLHQTWCWAFQCYKESSVSC